RKPITSVLPAITLRTARSISIPNRSLTEGTAMRLIGTSVSSDTGSNRRPLEQVRATPTTAHTYGDPHQSVDKPEQRLLPGVMGADRRDDHDDGCRYSRRDDVIAPTQQGHRDCAHADQCRHPQWGKGQQQEIDQAKGEADAGRTQP